MEGHPQEPFGVILDSFKVRTLVLPVPTDRENFIEEVGIRSTHFRLFWGDLGL